VIRRATVADEQVLRELWEEFDAEIPEPEGFEPETWDEEWVDVRRDIEEGVVCIAEDDGGAIGYMRGRRLERGAMGRIPSAYVRPRARRQGVTRALLAEVVAALKELGADYVSLHVLVSNQTARAAWQRLGFEDTTILMTAPVSQLEATATAAAGPSHGAVFVQTDDAAKIEQIARRYVPRLGRSEWTEVTASDRGWVSVRDELCDRDPPLLQRLAKELSYASGTVVCALGVERGAAVRYALYERGNVVDEYLSVPELYGPLPPGDVIALGANPRVVSRLTGADPERVRRVARTAASPDELPPAEELHDQIVELFGLA
jgi:ribosomal protein S18 acetylase RimI-like enzyme